MKTAIILCLLFGLSAMALNAAEKEEASKVDMAGFKEMKLNYDTLQKEIASPSKLDRKVKNHDKIQKDLRAFRDTKLDKSIDKIVVVDECSKIGNASEAKKCSEEKISKK